MSPNMEKALDLVTSTIEKKYGKGILMKLTDKVAVDLENIISSGSIALDSALGIGGYRKGRIIEIYGPESSGKTTLTLHAVAEAQKQGITCAFIDAEHSLDPQYAQRLGVDLEKLLVSQPDYGEQALEVADMLAKSGEVGFIVIDSVAALVPKAELEGEMGDAHVGLQARMMSQAMRKLAGTVNKTNCIVFFINQIRMKIGVFFGNPETVSGGGALKFYASQRLDIRRIGAVKQGDNIIGNKTRVKVVKNKLAPPFKEAEFEIRYGVGIDKLAEILDLGVEDQVINKSGSWYDYQGERLGQGKENSIAFLKENKELRQKIEDEILELRGLSCLLVISNNLEN